jgi:hypothetical protein
MYELAALSVFIIRPPQRAVTIISSTNADYFWLDRLPLEIAGYCREELILPLNHVVTTTFTLIP